MDDLEFVQRCIKGDKASWDDFVERYSRLIYNYIYAILRSKGLESELYDCIQDAYQDVFLSLLKDGCRKLRNYDARNGCSLASWLRIITINHTIDFLKKEKKLISLDSEPGEELSLKDSLVTQPYSGRHDLMESEEKSLDLKECIERLDQEDKYFLELHLNQDISLEKVKDILRINRGAADMRKSRIVERLKDCFKSKGFTLD